MDGVQEVRDQPTSIATTSRIIQNTEPAAGGLSSH